MKLDIELARLLPAPITLSVMRLMNGIQLGTEQLRIISAIVREKAPCRFLVFGLGRDSEYWSLLNREGVTVFLENNEFWYEEITGRSRNLTAFLVEYGTERRDWERLLERPDLLDMPLPGDIKDHKWDVILVDAPIGKRDRSPGRMKSIFLASRLIKNSGDVFVHDCQRKVEDVYSSKFLKKDNLMNEIKGSTGLLRHYRITTPCA
jgi:glucuronoxylan 4-O-methyltransferase